jgi:predicted dehydrogenase
MSLTPSLPATPDSPIRTAVLGFGLAGKVFHCPFVSAVPGLELSAIVQRKGDEAARAYPSARILRSADEAFADPSLDLIVVATPSETHFDLAAQALQAGKHVVVDKPITSSSKSAQTLIGIAKAHSRILAPFHNRRWDGDFLTLRKLLTDATLGRVVEIVSRFDRYRPLQRPNTWKEVASPATGFLYDLGPHLVDQALALPRASPPPSTTTAKSPTSTMPSMSSSTTIFPSAAPCATAATPPCSPPNPRHASSSTAPTAASASTASTRRSPRSSRPAAALPSSVRLSPGSLNLKPHGAR